MNWVASATTLFPGDAYKTHPPAASLRLPIFCTDLYAWFHVYCKGWLVVVKIESVPLVNGEPWT